MNCTEGETHQGLIQKGPNAAYVKAPLDKIEKITYLRLLQGFIQQYGLSLSLVEFSSERLFHTELQCGYSLWSAVNRRAADLHPRHC